MIIGIKIKCSGIHNFSTEYIMKSPWGLRVAKNHRNNIDKVLNEIIMCPMAQGGKNHRREGPLQGSIPTEGWQATN